MAMLCFITHLEIVNSVCKIFTWNDLQNFTDWITVEYVWKIQEFCQQLFMYRVCFALLYKISGYQYYSCDAMFIIYAALQDLILH